MTCDVSIHSQLEELALGSSTTTVLCPIDEAELDTFACSNDVLIELVFASDEELDEDAAVFCRRLAYFAISARALRVIDASPSSMARSKNYQHGRMDDADMEQRDW
jgi:hypothetical protein